MMNASWIVPAAAFAAAACAGFASGADLPREGTYDIETCFARNSTRIDYSATHYAYSYEEAGMSISTPAGGMFDGEAIRCVGMVASFDGKRMGGAVCEGTAKDGDRRLTRFDYDNENNLVRRSVSGTGKYDGLVASGTYRTIGPPVPIKTGASRLCNRQTGTYKLK
jgi:hypothetical protein